MRFRCGECSEIEHSVPDQFGKVMATAGTVSIAVPERVAGTSRSRTETAAFGQHVAHISRQSSVFFIGTMFTAAAGYLFRVYLARRLGAEALGIYALGMTIVNFLAIFNCLGLPQSAVRFVASYSATGRWEQLGRFLGRSCAVLLACNLPILAVMVTIGPWFAVRFYHAPALVPLLWLFALIMLLGNFTTFFGQALTGYKDVSRRTVITNFIGSPLTMAATVILLVIGAGLRGYILAQLAGATIVLLLLIVSVWKLTPVAARNAVTGRLRLEKEVVSFSTVSLGIALLELLMSQSDKVFVGMYLSARDVGVYAMAMTLVAFVPVALQSVNQIFSPVIADLHARGEQELLGRLFQTLTKWILGLTLPLAMVVMIFSRPLMSIFGRDFEAGWPILVIGTLGQLINCAAGSAGYLLLMSGNQRRLIRVQAVIGALTPLFSLALIPKWGMVGAAIVAAVTGAVCNMLCLREVFKALRVQPYNRGYVKLIPPLVSVLAICILLSRTFLPSHSPAVTIACALLVSYAVFTGLTLTLGLSADDQLVATVVTSKLWMFPRAKSGPRLSAPGRPEETPV